MNKERIIDTFFDLVKIDSETGNEKGVADYLQKVLTELGFSVIFDDANQRTPSNTGNLIAKLGNTKQADTLMLSSHMDTVKPGNGIVPYINEDGYIVSEGITILGSDDKAGITAIIEAIKHLKEQNIAMKPLEIVFTISEEGGLNGSKYLDYSLLNSKKAVVFDNASAVGCVVIQAPGQDRINVVVKGKASHAGSSPENGISAIQIAAAAINKMTLLKVDDETTANIGTINGGTATNIVCPEVKIRAEARSLMEDKLIAQTAHMVKCFEDAAQDFGALVDIEVERAYDAFKIDANCEVSKMVGAVIEKVGLTPSFISTGGGSDTNNYNKNGIEAVNLGLGVEKPHTYDERIKVDSLVKITEVACELIRRD